MIHKHKWAPTGLYQGGYLTVPCLEPTCQAYVKKINDKWFFCPNGFGISIAGMPLDIEDNEQGSVAKIVCREAENLYGLPQLNLKPGDIVLDIGAHVGIISIYLAKRYPGIIVHAYEPVLENYERIKRNAKANGVQIAVTHAAIMGQAGEVDIISNQRENSGAASVYKSCNANNATCSVRALAFRDIIVDDKIALLKMDCEGAEYDILNNNLDLLDRVDQFRAEFHINKILEEKGYSPEKLIRQVMQYLSPSHMRISMTRMAD